MSAYAELYLNDAMSALGSMFDTAVHVLSYEPDTFMDMFIVSSLSEQFEIGNPKYVGGMSGAELAAEVVFRSTDQYPVISRDRVQTLDQVYWSGWVLAYYQWKSGRSFRFIRDHGLTMSRIMDMYILHEAGEDKFVTEAELIIAEHKKKQVNALKRFRKYCEYTQRELSARSGVALRMIQLYEQGQNDLRKASAETVTALAGALKCSPQELLE